MFGVNYRYVTNEEKGVIKLRPTAGSLIVFMTLSGLSWLVGAKVADHLLAKAISEPDFIYGEDILTYDD